MDDEPALRDIARAALQRAGSEVHTATDGEYALETAKHASRPYDLVVTDHAMPRKDGPTLIRDLRELGWYGPVILCCGHGLSDPETMGLDAARVTVLQKPVDIEELIETVSFVLEKPTAARRR